MQAIESIVAAHPKGIGVQGIRRELDREVPRRTLFSDNELDESATTEDFSVVRQEGVRRVRRNLKHYNLDAIISVGYRVHSRRGVRFRQWATRTLRDHLVRGYTLNDDSADRQPAGLTGSEIQRILNPDA